MEDKITIIEGPPPTFETVDDAWPLGLNESPFFVHFAMTRLRTFDGPSLVERCRNAWRHQQPIYLEFRDLSGLEQQTPIVAARNVIADEGDMLFLWVRLSDDDVELEFDYENDQDDDDDLDPPEWMG